MRTTDAAIWDRIIQPEQESFSPAAAEALMSLEFAAADRRRMHELAEKARAGSLTEAEQEEVASYERVGSFLSLLKAKARRCLKNGSPA
jgi:hypothetical protein